MAGLPARLILIFAALSAMPFSISMTLVRLVLLALLKLLPVLSLWLTVLPVVVVAHFRPPWPSRGLPVNAASPRTSSVIEPGAHGTIARHGRALRHPSPMASNGIPLCT